LVYRGQSEFIAMGKLAALVGADDAFCKAKLLHKCTQDGKRGFLQGREEGPHPTRFAVNDEEISAISVVGVHDSVEYFIWAFVVLR
jgi:hypothetical protein